MTVEEDIKLFESSKSNSDYFKEQINLIKDDDLRSWLTDFLDNKVERFEIERPTSSTGKFHPANQNLKAGNGRHIKSLVKFMQVFERARPDLNWDCMYAAGILHDLTKYESKDSKYTDEKHPLTMANLISNDAYDNFSFSLEALFKSGRKKCIRNYKLKSKIDYIAMLVRWHMGRFDFENSNKNQISKGYMDKAKDNLYNEELWIVHYCDMLASAKWVGTEETF